MSVRVAAVVMVVSAVGWAQSSRPIPAFELERLRLNAGARETLVLSTGDLLPAQALRLSLWGHYQHAPLLLTADGAVVGAAVSGRVTAQLFAAYAPTDWLDIGLLVPVVVTQFGDDLSMYGLTAPASAGLGAPWLSARVGVLQERRGQPLDLGAQLEVGLPFGSAEALARDPGVGVAMAARVGAGKSLHPLIRLGGEVGVLLRGAQVLSAGSTITDEVGSALRVGIGLSTQGFALQGELSVRADVPFTASPVGFEVLLGARYTFLKDFEVSLLGGPGLGHAPGTPAFRVGLGLSWAPSFAPAGP